MFIKHLRSPNHNQTTHAMNPPENQHHYYQQNPWLLSQQPNIISNTLLPIISPFISIFSSPTKQHSTMLISDTTPPNNSSENNSSISMLFKKAMLGFMAAGYMCLLLMGLMLLSVVLGVFLVRLWVEEPVFVEENLYFDYTDVNPSAVLHFGSVDYYYGKVMMMKGVPVGHVCDVRLAFVMPDSDYNRYLGMFQVVAEAVTSNGDVIARTSHPCMPHFRSQPIRAMQTLLWSAPLVLGIRSEIQTVNMPLLRYKEHYHPRTQAIRISLIPRAGMPFLPQLYEAKVTLRSELPWRKALIRNWKWTFYVWTSLYVYLTLLVLLISCFRSIMFPAMTTVSGYQRLATPDDLVEEQPQAFGTRGRPTSENLKRWRQGRSKRKAMVMGGGSDATSLSVTRDEDASVTTEEVGDSESVCQ